MKNSRKVSSESHASSLSGPPSLIDVAPRNGYSNGYLTDEFDEESDEDEDYLVKPGSKSSRAKGIVLKIKILENRDENL